MTSIAKYGPPGSDKFAGLSIHGPHNPAGVINLNPNRDSDSGGVAGVLKMNIIAKPGPEGSDNFVGLSIHCTYNPAGEINLNPN
ncbi:hypothetical protein SDC9_28981 [bioreactor metagenome]|jgi:hypothetical protein|uniref:Uncharacterized protein n=1 Tax=bioreactor metagenome TaxID=1076179 RepID=A0A644UW01_9ZZZZ